MDEPSDAISGDVELHSMMNAAPTMEETMMEETIPAAEPESTQPERTTAVIETQIEEENQVADSRQQEISASPEPTTDNNLTTNNSHKSGQENSTNITNLNDATIHNNHQQQDGAYNSCILNQSSVDAQMEKVIDNIVELSGQFAPNLEQQESLIDKDKEVEHIQREIVGERNILPENPIQTVDVVQHEKPEQPKSSNIDKPALIESLPQLPDLTKLAHEIVPEITSLENLPYLKVQEIDHEINEKSSALEKVEEPVKAGRKLHTKEHSEESQAVQSVSGSKSEQSTELAKQENLSETIVSKPINQKIQEGVSIGIGKKEKEAKKAAREATRKEQEEIEELEKLAKESEQKSEENSMVEDVDFSVGNQDQAPEVEQPEIEQQDPKETMPATVETKQLEEVGKQKEADIQTRSGRPVRAVRNRVSTRLASPEEPKIKPEKRQNKRTHDQMEREAPAKSSDQVIKAPIKLTLRPASSRSTISTAAPSKRVEKTIKKPTTIHPIDYEKKYNCGDCSFSTDRLNNIVYHKQKVCQHTFEVFNAQVEDWKKTLSSPKSNSKRFSR